MDHSLPQLPEGIASAFAEAWNDRDADRLAWLFDEDAEFVNVVGLWWHDREAIRRAHAYGLAHLFNRSTLRVGRVRVKSLAADIAVVHARLSLSGQTAVAGIAVPGVRTSILSFVLHRTDQGWRCASAQNTDVVPRAETNVVDSDGSLRSIDYRTEE